MSQCHLYVQRFLVADVLVCRDEAQLSKLQQLGMTATEETKLLAMRDYILKLANAISRFVFVTRYYIPNSPISTQFCLSFELRTRGRQEPQVYR
jgi:hypothetical protein